MSKPVLLVTIGDPAGIGPEIIEKALASGELPDDFTIEVVGDPTAATLGKPDFASARASFHALQEAGERWRSDPQVAGIITAPVSKAQLSAVGFRFPGQTEFFAELSGTSNYAMCLSGDNLTVGLVTIHIPLAEIVAGISQNEIIRTAKLLGHYVALRLGRPGKIAIAGVNPHAGEGGKFGHEEEDHIVPAIRALQAHPELGDFSGPHVPDAIYRQAAHGQYDAVLAMYHDQGLIPLKLIDFDSAVNITLGLPKPRTSPDHGTAFDIAGQNRANPSSLIHAIHRAAEMARRGKPTWR